MCIRDRFSSAAQSTSSDTWSRLMGSSHSQTSSQPYVIGRHHTAFAMSAPSTASPATTENSWEILRKLQNRCPGWLRRIRRSHGPMRPNSRLKIPKTLVIRKDLRDISCIGRVIADFVPNFVAIATGVGRGRIFLASFNSPTPKTPCNKVNWGYFDTSLEMSAKQVFLQPSVPKWLCFVLIYYSSL